MSTSATTKVAAKLKVVLSLPLLEKELVLSSFEGREH